MPENRQTNEDDKHDDSLKAHISRIPTKFTKENVERILKERLGGNTGKDDDDDAEDEEYDASVELIYPHSDDEEEGGGDGENTKDTENYDDDRGEERKDDNANKEHRGFGFVTFSSETVLQRALKLETIRGGRKANSSKQHTMYIRPYTSTEEDQNKCYLWTQNRCPYGDECKFTHAGPGGCKEQQPAGEKKKGRCFAYKKGKCDKREDCPFSHDFEVKPTATTTDKSTKKIDSEKDCINWKTKGKCRKGDVCPYRHDPKKQEAALLKKQQKQQKTNDDADADAAEKQDKEKQPLSVRVFGLNYETTEGDIREFFKECGKIQDITFPIFDDSGRSKGYCGVWFSSPKAVAKAIELDGKELQGRWLQIQAGKMYLKQWEQNHPPVKKQRIS
jgi:RNA recognition motif-containing protein